MLFISDAGLPHHDLWYCKLCPHGIVFHVLWKDIDLALGICKSLRPNLLWWALLHSRIPSILASGRNNFPTVSSRNLRGAIYPRPKLSQLGIFLAPRTSTLVLLVRTKTAVNSGDNQEYRPE